MVEAKDCKRRRILEFLKANLARSNQNFAENYTCSDWWHSQDIYILL